MRTSWRRTRLVGFGILAAVAVNLVIALIIGQAWAGWCFLPVTVFNQTP